MAEPVCKFCGGDGDVEVYDTQGFNSHTVTCPECYGSGVGEDAEEKDEDGEEFEYPPSTAASITTPEQLKAAIERWNRAPPKPPAPLPKPSLWSRLKSWIGDIHDLR